MTRIILYKDHIEWIKDRKLHREDGPAREWERDVYGRCIKGYCIDGYLDNSLAKRINVNNKSIY